MAMTKKTLHRGFLPLHPLIISTLGIKNEIFSLKDQRGIEEYRQYLKELRNGKI